MRLSPVDHVFTGPGAYPINFLFFFDGLVDEGKLKASLEKTLEVFTPAASRLQKVSAETLAFNPTQHYGWNFQKSSNPPDMTQLSEMSQFFKSAKSIEGENLLEITLTHFTKTSCLGVSLSHCVVDGYSYFMFLGAWSKNMRELKIFEPDLNREKLIPLDSKEMDLSGDSIYKATGFAFSPSARPDDHNDIQWELIDYTESDLKKLYASTSEQSALRLSLNDVLCADLWKKLVQRYQKVGQEVTLSCAFDYRRVFPAIGPLYFGNAVRGASFKMNFEDVLESSSARIAEKIGAVVRSISEEDVVGSLKCLEQIRLSQGISALSRFHVADPHSGFLFTNLSRLPLLDIDFGVGPPVDFRILTPARRAAVILPLVGGLRVQIAH